ncbi:MAG: MFS transporter, partial [Chloroflexi bacterium]
ASPLAGTLVGVVGGEWALATSGAVYLVAAAVMLRLPDPRSAGAQVGSVLQSAWQGLLYTLRNPTLRGLALTLSTFNIGNGLIAIAVPVLVLGRFHSGPSTVGLLGGLMGGAGLVSALLAGRISSQGRERQMMVASILVATVATALLPLSPNLLVVAMAIALFGLAMGPFDIGLFTLRQRRTDPMWFGRAFAVSMALNSVGNPIGSALAGPLIGRSLDVALWAAVAAALLSAVFPILMIPAERDAQAAAAAR